LLLLPPLPPPPQLLAWLLGPRCQQLASSYLHQPLLSRLVMLLLGSWPPLPCCCWIFSCWGQQLRRLAEAGLAQLAAVPPPLTARQGSCHYLAAR